MSSIPSWQICSGLTLQKWHWIKYQVDRMTPASACLCTAQLHCGKNRAQRGTADLDKEQHAQHVSQQCGERERRISQVWWHHTDSQHLRGELVPCSASRGGLEMRQQGQGFVFKSTGELPGLAHRETWESQGCCNGWRWVEAKDWHLRE